MNEEIETNNDNIDSNSKVLITEANTKTREKREMIKRLEKRRKEKVREDLIQIWSNLSKNGKDRLLDKKLDENQLFNETEETLKKLMKKFTLKDTVLFEHGTRISKNQIPIDSKKTISFLKKQFSQNASKKINSNKRNDNLKKFQKIRTQKLKALKEGNIMRHRTTFEHQLNLIKQANFNEKEFLDKRKPNFFGDLITKASNSLGISSGKKLKNTGIYKIG